jgi:hypothetical protein
VESGRRRASRVLERPRRLNCHRNFKPLVFRQFQPGVDIQGVNERFSGDWYVSSVTHKLDTGGYKTDFTCVR